MFKITHLEIIVDQNIN